MSLYTLNAIIPATIVFYADNDGFTPGVVQHKRKLSNKIYLCDFFGIEYDDIFTDSPRSRVYDDDFNDNCRQLVISKQT